MGYGRHMHNPKAIAVSSAGVAGCSAIWLLQVGWALLGCYSSVLGTDYEVVCRPLRVYRGATSFRHPTSAYMASLRESKLLPFCSYGSSDILRCAIYFTGIWQMLCGFLSLVHLMSIGTPLPPCRVLPGARMSLHCVVLICPVLQFPFFVLLMNMLIGL